MIFKGFSLVYVSITLFNYTTALSLDDEVDKYLEYRNAVSKRTVTTFKDLGNVTLGNLNLSGVTILGLDSLYRSGPCHVLPVEGGAVYTYHFGLSYLDVIARRLSLDGRPASQGSCRIRGNSLALSYLVTDIGCRTNVTQLQVERLSGSVLLSSDPLLHRTTLDGLLQDIRLNINRYLDSRIPGIQDLLGRHFCKHRPVKRS